jgi:hypothetical protein
MQDHPQRDSIARPDRPFARFPKVGFLTRRGSCGPPVRAQARKRGDQFGKRWIQAKAPAEIEDRGRNSFRRGRVGNGFEIGGHLFGLPRLKHLQGGNEAREMLFGKLNQRSGGPEFAGAVRLEPDNPNYTVIVPPLPFASNNLPGIEEKFSSI